MAGRSYAGPRRCGRGALIFALFGCLLGCARQRAETASAVIAPVPSKVTHGPVTSLEEAGRAPLLSYDDFHSPGLKRVQAEAVRTAPDPAAAEARIRQAMAQVVAAQAATKPLVTLRGSGSGSEADLGRGRDSYTLAAGLSYDPDLRGRWRAAREAAEFSADAAREDARQARKETAASVASFYLARGAAKARLALVRRQTENDRLELEALRADYAMGVISGGELLRQRAFVEANAVAEAEAKADVQAAEASLRALTGGKDGAFFGDEPLPDPETLPEPRMRAEAAARTPEVMAARRRLLAACKRADSAEAARLPSFTLSFSAGFSGAAASLLESWALSSAADLLAPLSDGGALKAEARRQYASAQEQFQLYRKAVFVAVRDAETALARDAGAQDALRAQRRQEQTVREMLRKVRTDYAAGAAEARDFIDALAQVRAAERQTLQAVFTALAARTETLRAAGVEAEIKE